MSASLPPSSASLRLLTMADLPRVLDIECRAYTYPWSEKLLRDSLAGGHHCWGFEVGGEIVAYCVWMTVLDEIHILNLAVCPHHQRRGYARFLLEALRQEADTKQAHHLFLEVRVSNAGAQRLYESFGFCESGRRRNYYPAGDSREDALLMGMSW